MTKALSGVAASRIGWGSVRQYRLKERWIVKLLPEGIAGEAE